VEDRRIHLQLGISAIILSLLFLVVLIPNWVSSPSNVSKMILSPLMWPNVIAGATGLIGAALLLGALRMPRLATEIPPDTDDPARAYLRLFVLALILIVTMPLMPRLGLVWTTMGVSALLALLVRTSHPKTAFICAICVPLVLYAFFAHVAGVAIPQGNFVRLP